MPHGAYLGMTTAGKTYGAQQSARDFRRRGIGVLVLHKPREPWPADCVSWQTDNPDEFLRMFWAARVCACFMELADADVEAADTRFHKCFTQGRHEGHRCYFLSQRAAQVHALGNRRHIRHQGVDGSNQVSNLGAQQSPLRSRRQAVQLRFKRHSFCSKKMP